MIYSIHIVFFFNDTATTEIYTLSLHDALPIFQWRSIGGARATASQRTSFLSPPANGCGLATEFGSPTVSCSSSYGFATPERDRKSTRLNSSHGYISYAVFCLKKKKKNKITSEK